jgi:hypothetical protein
MVNNHTKQIRFTSVQLGLSPSINQKNLRLMLQKRNNKGRQVGRGKIMRGLGPQTTNQFSLNSHLDLDDTISYLTLRLYYYDDLVEERNFKKDQSGGWIQVDA